MPGKTRTRRTWIVLICLSLLLLLSLPLLSGCGAGGGASSGMVYGKVYERQTGNLASGSVRVRIAGAVTTVVSGVYQTGKLPYGQYLATVEGEGYETQNVTVNIVKVAQPKDIYLDLQPDNTAPAVESVSPEPGATGTGRGTAIRITFSEPMNQTTTGGAFSVSPSVAGSLSWSGHELTFQPQQLLTARTQYTVTIGTAATDRSGNALASPYTWSFTTGDSSGAGLSGKLTFASQRERGILGIFMMAPQPGGQVTKVYWSGGEDEAPAWSPDGSKLAFASRRLGTMNQELWVMPANGSDPTRLTSSQGNDTAPAWSPDGAQIIFQSDWDYRYNRPSNSGFHLWRIPATGGTPQLMTADDSWAEAPSWSPDGAKIAFASNRSGQMHIYVVNSLGETAGFQAEGPLGADPTDATDTGPVWSPDGTKIAFTSDRTGVWQIYVMDATGDNVVQVTHSIGDDKDPSWSPDGQSLAFVSYRDGNHEIYKVSVDGTGETRLTNNTVSDYNPAWYR